MQEAMRIRGMLCTAAAVIILVLAGWLGVGCSGPGDEASSSLPQVVLTPSAWPDGPDVLTFAVIGDFGTGGSDQFRVAAQMEQAYQEQPYEYLLTVGDNAYDGTVAERAAEVIDRPYRPLFDAGVRFRPTLGNHDHDDDYLPVTLSGLVLQSRLW